MDVSLPAAETLHDVRVMPFARPWIGGVDRAHAPWHAGVLRGQEAINRFDPPNGSFVQCDGRFFYGGPLHDHFGHFMIDAIPRLWGFQPERHDGVVFPVVGALGSLPRWMLDGLGYFGVAADRLKLVREPTIFRQVDFAPPGSVLRRGPERWYLDWLRDRQPAFPGGHGDRLYYGRTHIRSKGTVMGESYFAAALESNGFRSVRPEALTVAHQLKLAATAGTIVFLEGSSIYITELLGHVPAQVFMLPRRPLGHTLFGPQLAPRASRFTTLGATVLRKPNRRGLEKPDSPSYLLNPRELFLEMEREDLVQPAFDVEAFLHAEERDTLDYFGGDVDAARIQLDDVRASLRAALASGSP